MKSSCHLDPSSVLSFFSLFALGVCFVFWEIILILSVGSTELSEVVFVLMYISVEEFSHHSYHLSSFSVHVLGIIQTLGLRF